MNLRKLETRQPFYIAGRESAPKNDEVTVPWRGPDEYLEEAIRTGCSDLSLAFLQTPTGREFVTALELHHQQHGLGVAWPDCPEQACQQDGLAWCGIAVAALAVLS